MQWLHERRGETVIRQIPERRILVYVAAMMGGVAFTMNFGQRLASPVPVVVTTIGLGVAIWLGHRLAARWSHGWQGAEVGIFCCRAKLAMPPVSHRLTAGGYPIFWPIMRREFWRNQLTRHVKPAR